MAAVKPGQQRRRSGHSSKTRMNAAAGTPSVLGNSLALDIQDLSHDGRGIGRWQGKAVFVDGALPGEQVTACVTHSRSQWLEARLESIEVPSPQRIQPLCPAFATCGGCQLQHLSIDDQRHYKQHQLMQTLSRQGIKVAHWDAPLLASSWAYRRRVRFVLTTQGALALRARGGQQQVVVPVCQQLLPELQQLQQQLQADLSNLPCKGIRELELFCVGNTALTLHVDALWRDPYLPAWQTWAEARGLGLYLQPLQRQTPLQVVVPVALDYALDGLTLSVTPDQFVQPHEQINAAMVQQVVQWLQPTPDSQVLDLFCGMGNFSLPLARQARGVLGLESNPASLALATANAQANDLLQARFAMVDLFDDQTLLPRGYDRVVLDPPRDGAQLMCQQLAKRKEVTRIVYVSCHPATLARDVALLQAGGFKVSRACLIDQFPQTYHMEAMLLLERPASSPSL